MRPLRILAMLLLSSSLEAETFLVDFNTIGGDAGAGWNVYADPSDLGGPLKNTDGKESGLTISATGSFVDSMGTEMRNAASAPSWVTSEAGNDFHWTGNTESGAEFTLTVDGLKGLVSVDLFASRHSKNMLTGNFEYSTDDGATWKGFTVLDKEGTPSAEAGWDAADTQAQVFSLDTDGYDAGRYMNLSNVQLSGGRLLIRGTLKADGGGDDYIGINAMRLNVD